MINKTILHYKILEKLGEGGMGVVYLAEDTKLERKVAIKFLPRHISINDEDRQRFEIEAKAAAALNHPNIATIHAIEESGEDIFIVMEYIDGRELQDLMAGNPGMDVESGNVGAKHSWQPSESKSTDPARNASPLPLPLDDAINYSAQIASGLQAAHEKGVVHRDIKSANIMVTHKNQIKIMDFGLAKVAGSDIRLTKKSTTLGTAAYMSPEQAQGEENDHRTDIWAFGVVLYEMLTGVLPFRGEYEQAVIYAIINEAHKPIHELNSDIPEALENIVDKCLAKDPANRYQSTEAVLEDLRILKGDSSSGSTATRITAHKPLKNNKLRNILVMVFMAIILFAITGYFFFSSEPESTERIPLAVVDFVNETSEPELNSLSGLLITSLEQSRRLTVFSRSRMFDVLYQMGKTDVTYIDEALGREICQRAEIKALVVSSVRKFGSRYSIDLKILDPAEGNYIFTEKVDGTGQESIPGMIDEIAERTRLGLREKEAEIRAAKQNVADVTTTNLEAYRHLFKSQEFIDKLQFIEARVELRKAIALDSTFGLAYYWLAYANTWGNQRLDAELSRVSLEKALALLDKIPEKERFLVRAWDAQDYSTRIAILQEMELYYPNHKEMLFLIGDFAYHDANYELSLEYFNKVFAIDPNHLRSLFHLGDIYIKFYGPQGDFREVINRLQQVEIHSFAGSHIFGAIADILIFQGQYEEAERELKKLIAEEQLPEVKEAGYSKLATFYQYLGKHRKSLASLDEAIKLAWQNGDTSAVAIYFDRKAKRFLGGWNDRENAIKEFEKTYPLDDNLSPSDLFWFSRTGFLAEIGDYEAAEMEIQQMGSRWQTCVRSWIYSAKGDCDNSEILADSLSGIVILEKILYYILANCFYENNQLEKAEKYLRRLQDLLIPHTMSDSGPDLRSRILPRSFYLMGKIYEKKGDPQGAIKHYEEFLDIWKDADPDLLHLMDAKARYARLKASVKK